MSIIIKLKVVTSNEYISNYELDGLHQWSLARKWWTEKGEKKFTQWDRRLGTQDITSWERGPKESEKWNKISYDLNQSFNPARTIIYSI